MDFTMLSVTRIMLGIFFISDGGRYDSICRRGEH